MNWFTDYKIIFFFSVQINEKIEATIDKPVNSYSTLLYKYCKFVQYDDKRQY